MPVSFKGVISVVNTRVLFAVFLLQSVCDLKLPAVKADLEIGYYRNNGICHCAEDIVARVVHDAYLADRTVTAILIRLQFHDCFVQGCDASIMETGTFSEQTSLADLSVRGYNVIKEAKAALEEFCPGRLCPNISDFSDPRMYTKVSLEFKSQFRWDLGYFRNVRLKRGLLRIDDEIGTDPATRPQFNQIASSNFLFDREFIQSLYKMSQIGVITNPALGNIRKVCHIAGAPTTTTISMPLQLEEVVLEAHSAF
ncbi:unnamed protein product [Sphagnum compactum]